MKKILFLIFFSYPVYGDRGMISISMPNISIYATGQHAIIGWDGKKEILILSVDAYADTEAHTLEILPLPAEAKIREGNFNSFEEIQRIINKRRPRIFATLAKGRFLPPGEEGVDILFYKKIGPHNITCVKSEKYEEFTGWAKNFIIKQGFDTTAIGDELKNIIMRYINQGIFYFIFDIVELDSQKKSISPLIYEFDTKYLFFPLYISSLTKGNTNIQIFLITELPPCILDLTPLKLAEYIGYRGINEYIMFEILPEEINKIEEGILKLFPKGGWLTALKFEGETNHLYKDLKLTRLSKIIKY